jgi:hypothetical protein
MAPSYSELGLILGDVASLSDSGAKNLNERFDTAFQGGDKALVKDPTGFVVDDKHALLHVYPEGAEVAVVVGNDEDIFEAPTKPSKK